MSVPDLPQLQRTFQDYLFGRDNEMPALIRDYARASRQEMLGVYRNAYWLRLIEVLRNDYVKLHLLVGDDIFDRLARNYIAANPSHHFSARWVGAKLPAFLATAAPWSQNHALAAMAAFEWAQIMAFDADDRPVARLEDLAQVPPHNWPALRFRLQASVQLVTAPAPVIEAWSALHRGEAAPPPAALGDDKIWLVWRQELEVRFRAIDAEEQAALQALIAGEDFAAICERVAALVGEARAAYRAAELLQGWIATGVIGEVVGETDGSAA